MSSQRNFSSTVELINTSQKVANVIREAQVKGLAVEILDDDYMEAGRGVHFDGSNTYIYFSDKNGNLKFDSGEEITEHSLGAGFVFGDILCGNSSCDELNIVYQRPEARARFHDGSDTLEGNTVSIQITSPEDRSQTVKVFKTGQITVIEE